MATLPSTSLGSLLRDGRLRQRLSIAECAKNTHVASRYLEALEEERWSDLPSESHRLGFLRLYSRFLGVPAEEAVALYQQSKNAVPTSKIAPSTETKVKAPSRTPGGDTKTSLSAPQVVSLIVVVLLLSWFGYHWFHEESPGEQTASWTRVQPHHTRLGASKTPVILQQLRLQAHADCWLRILNDQQLVYEGYLRKGSNKTWSGAGPFSIKMGNKDAVSVFWNDQEVDLKNYQGPVLDLKLPIAPVSR